MASTTQPTQRKSLTLWMRDGKQKLAYFEDERYDSVKKLFHLSLIQRDATGHEHFNCHGLNEAGKVAQAMAKYGLLDEDLLPKPEMLGLHATCSLEFNDGKLARQKLPVKVGLSTLETPMTKTQAARYGNNAMPSDLKRAGFKCSVFQSDPQLHGSLFYRINYSK